MHSLSFIKWLKAGRKPKMTFSWTKNSERNDPEIDPRNWASGNSERWCLMREQRKGDFLRIHFRHHMTVYRIIVRSHREFGYPIKGKLDVWRADEDAWNMEKQKGIEQDWSATTIYRLDKGILVKGIGFRVSECRMEPPGEQYPHPAWSIARVEIMAKRWWFIKRKVTLPWD